MPVIQIGRKSISKLPVASKATVYYDSTLKGFGLRVSPTGEPRWLVEYRPGVGGRGVSKRRMVFGSLATLNPDAARDRARTLLANVQLGLDPAKEKSDQRRGMSVSDLLTVYLSEHIIPKRKLGTKNLFEFIVRKHLAPAFKAKRAADLTRHEIAKWHRETGKLGVQITANRALTILASAYEFGKRAGYLDDGLKNPVTGIEKFRENARQRYLSTEEIARLGETLRIAETIGLPWNPDPYKKVKHAPKPENRNVIIDRSAIAAIRLLLFTGARLREILHLQWQFVDTQRGLLNLPDSKTGQKVVLLGASALSIFENLPRHSNSPFVFPGTPRNVLGRTEPSVLAEFKPRTDLNKPWARIRQHAQLDGLRLHDLRHSFASVGASSGLGLHILGKLLGHREAATTARYAHLADDPLRRAVDSISSQIQLAMNK